MNDRGSRLGQAALAGAALLALVLLLPVAFGACAAGDTGAAGHGPTGAGGDDGFVEPDGTSAACQEAADLKTSVACDYHAVMLDGMYGADNGCFVSFVANTSNERARIQVRFGEDEVDLSQYAKIPQGAGLTLTYADYDPTAGLAPGEVAILFLAGTYAQPGAPAEWNAPVPCPVPAAVPNGAQRHGTAIGQSFHITTSTPVVAYQMLPYGGGAAAVTGATLLIPSTAWDTSYVAVNAYGADLTAEFGVGPSMSIVAKEDDTRVSIVPNVFLGPGAGVSSAPAGVKTDYVLQAGQVLQFTQAAEITGSPVQADKPIGLFAGHQCTNTPATSPYCDHAEQQIPPVSALGHEYAAVGYRQRTAAPEQFVYRLVGAADGTTLTWDPAVGGPTTLSFGQIAEFSTSQPFVVRSQDAAHPFVLLSYMTGASAVNDGTTLEGYGDPDVVRVVPPAQFLSRYVFFTDPTYPETNLVVVRKRAEAGFADVVLDCAGTLSGWAPLGSDGQLEYTRTDLVRHNFQPQNGCDNGRREMHSDAPFGLWVWGWGSPESQPETDSGCTNNLPGYSCYVSYGYPAGEGLQILNDVDVPVPR